MSQKDFTFIKSESFIVVEHPSGQVVTGNYSKKVVEIASLTKIMTFYAVVQVLKMKEIDPEQ